ncbi:hypothetical protein CPC08DRAFT_348920 [Agrocybe pediades]|nr:hypothetical protein CPC08DRAFT_348920 [Agrocybe pediades]
MFVEASIPYMARPRLSPFADAGHQLQMELIELCERICRAILHMGHIPTIPMTRRGVMDEIQVHSTTEGNAGPGGGSTSRRPVDHTISPDVV